MGEVVQFPQLRPAKLFGLYCENDTIAAQHLIRQGKAQRYLLVDMPKCMRVNSLGEAAKGGVMVEGCAINEFEGLRTYFMYSGTV